MLGYSHLLNNCPCADCRNKQILAYIEHLAKVLELIEDHEIAYPRASAAELNEYLKQILKELKNGTDKL